MRARVLHAVLILFGLALVLYPLTIGAVPHPSCRGVPMRPGDVCAKAGDSGVQSFEQRAAASRQARPVIMAVGVLVVGFGSALLALETRRDAARSTAARVHASKTQAS
jgi:hypothetical protein